MTTLNCVLKRWKGKDVSADVLSCMKDGDKFVPYEIKACAGSGATTASTTASALRGIVLIRKGEITDYGDPDGEGVVFTLT